MKTQLSELGFTDESIDIFAGAVAEYELWEDEILRRVYDQIEIEPEDADISLKVEDPDDIWYRDVDLPTLVRRR